MNAFIPAEHPEISQTEFDDLRSWIIPNAHFARFPGIAMLRGCEEIIEPGRGAGSDVIFMREGFPFAIYEQSMGFKFLTENPGEDLCPQEFSQVADWVQEHGTYSTFPGLDALSGTEEIVEPLTEQQHPLYEARILYLRNGRPFCLNVFDIGYWTLS